MSGWAGDVVETMQAPLFVPACRPERFGKAALSGADGIILDLEDAVAAQDKNRARASLDRDFTTKPVLVRINAAGTPWHEADLNAVAALQPAAILLPKAEDPAVIDDIAARLAGRVPILALIETAAGLANARALAACRDVVRLAFGSVDFCADMGSHHLRDILLPARFELVLASRLAGIAPPLDGVTLNLDDPVSCHADALHARTLGMTGKLCIHPRQAEPVLRAFALSGTEIAWAARVLACGEGVARLDGEMVDEPVRRRARRIMQIARAANPAANEAGK